MPYLLVIKFRTEHQARRDHTLLKLSQGHSSSASLFKEVCLYIVCHTLIEDTDAMFISVHLIQDQQLVSLA